MSGTTEKSEARTRRRRQAAVVIISAAVAAALAAGAFAGLRTRRRAEAYRERCERGALCLDRGEYDEAAVEFRSAIALRPEAPDAYVGRGDARRLMEDYGAAVADYEKALSLDGGSGGASFGLALSWMELGETETALRVLRDGYSAGGDERLNDWAVLLRDRRGDSALRGAVFKYTADGGSRPLSGARVRLYRERGGTEFLVDVAESGADGVFSARALAADAYALRVGAAGCIPLTSSAELTDGGITYSEAFRLIPAGNAGADGTLELRVRSAVDAGAVPGAMAKLYPGWNRTGGRAEIDGVADGDGTIRFENVPVGYYTARVAAGGSGLSYTDVYQNVCVLPARWGAASTVALSPRLGAGETRIVLTWGAAPEDLDSHLTGEADGAYFHVYYGDGSYSDSGVEYVSLNTDSDSGFGPETIKISNGAQGVCTYYVYDYSNRYSESSEAMSASGATVRVYQEEGLTATYHVPPGWAGCKWTVFRLHPDGGLEAVNSTEGGADFR